MCWNCRSKPCFKGLFVKSPLKIRKNFPQTHQFILAKAFEIPKDFSRKVLWSGFGADIPTYNAHKKARHCRAFYYPNILLSSFYKRSKLFCFERSAADKTTVDIFHRKKFSSVRGLHRAAVLDRKSVSRVL